MITADSSAQISSEAISYQTRDLYRALFTQSPQPFALHSVTVSAAGKPLDCVCIDANVAFQTVLNVPMDRLIGGRVHEISPQFPKSSLFPVVEDVLFDHEPDHLTVLSPSNSRYYDVAVTLVAPGIVATVLSELIGIRGAEPPRRNGSKPSSAVAVLEPQPGDDASGPRGQPAKPEAPREKAPVAPLRNTAWLQTSESSPASGQSAGSPSYATIGGTHSSLAGERRSASAVTVLPATDPDSDFDESLVEIQKAMMAASMENYTADSPPAVGQAEPRAVINPALPDLRAALIDETELAEALPPDGDLWALLLRSSGEAIWVWDLRTSRVLFSNRWRAMLGYSPSEVREQFGQYARLVHPDDLPALLQAIQGYVSQQTPTFENEHRLRCRNGEYRWVHSRGSALRDGSGVATRLVAFQQDVHELRLADQRQERARLLAAALRSVRLAAARPQGRDTLLQLACSSLVERGLVQRAWIGEYDETTGVVAPVARDGIDKVDLGTIRVPKAGDPFRNGPTAMAIASRQPRVVGDVFGLGGQFAWAQQSAQIGYGSAAAFPLLVGERTFGALTVYAREPGFFGSDEVTLFEEISSALGFSLYVIEQAELRGRAENELQRASFHDRLTNLYNRPYFEEELRRLQGSRLYPITIISTDLDGMKIVNDVMGNRAGDQLLTVYANLLKSSFRTSDVVARVGGDEFAIILPTTDAEASQGLIGRLMERMNAHNLEGRTLPLSHSMGIATASEPFDSLEILCRQADNAMFIDRNRRAPTRGRNLVRVLMTALRKKDFASDGHVSRVKAMATALGEAAGLPAKDMDELALLSEIHDLGKIGIPDRVLFKPGPLDREEREQIKQHSALGYRIAKISPELEHVAELILYHQEWWNGAGYPTGIGGEEIPVSCRVLAIADAYDAMTSARPHRPALSSAEAVEEIRRGAGRQFDPAMVEKFLQIAAGS